MSDKEVKKKKKPGAKKNNSKKTGSQKTAKKKTENKKNNTKKSQIIMPKIKETGGNTGSKQTAGRKAGLAKSQTKLRLIKNGDIKNPTRSEKVKTPHKQLKQRDFSYGDKPTLGEWGKQHKSLVMIGTTIIFILLLLAAVYYYIIKTYTVTTVYVDGNVHYTNEEVMNIVMTGYYGNNSLYLSMKYRDKGVEGIPFVEKMDVNILSPNTIRINVYEKALAGYVEYLGKYMYFDKDGIVVENSNKRTAGVPQVTGLKFNYVVMHETLPVENEDIFKRVLNITQLLSKYTLAADKIYFDSDYYLTLFFKEIKVTVGSSEFIDEKIMRLKSILPKLEGKKGTLRLESFNDDTKNITFMGE